MLLRHRHHHKLFCVGFNKTGTTSFGTAVQQLGYRVAPQRQFELLLDVWLERRFSEIVKACSRFDAFQDIPFSLPFTFQALDQAFPRARFVLTVRRDSNTWYHSLVRYHTKLFGSGASLTVEDLRGASYCTPGWILRYMEGVFGIDEGPLYDPGRLIAAYERHNAAVMRYFAMCPNRLLVLDVSQPGAFQKLAEFLGTTCPHNDFPWENRNCA